MKKRIKKIEILCLSFILFTGKVWAADYSIRITSNTVTVDNSVSITIDGTDSDLTGRFNLSISDSSIASLSENSIWIEKNTGSITVNAKKAGTATITVTPTDGISDSDAKEVSLQKKTITITVNDKTVITNNPVTPRAKSSNNYLTSITIDGLKLNEDFNKETLEYTVDIPADTESIKINAQLADSSAKVNGTGEIKVTTGINKLELVVTAENGSKRTYKITATVLEEEPITTTISNAKYTVIRKRKDLPEISEYNVPKDIKLANDIVEGYYNEKLKYDLVGLKDEQGKINYYIYNKGKYTEYNEYTIGGTTLQILDKKVDNYKATSFTYNGKKIASYQEVKLDLLKNTYALDNNDISGNQYYLFYAKNIETGKENLYQYDATEKTVQRYNIEVIEMYKNNSDTYYLYLLISLILSVILLIIVSLLLISNNKKNRFIKTRKKEINKMYEEEN